MPIAIVGMACRLPGADDLEQYWRLIQEGRSALTEIPSQRLDPESYFDPRKGVPGKTYTRLGGVVRPRPLDSRLCPIPSEFSCHFEESVATMLDVASAACRDAHLDPFHMPSNKTGVFIGHARGSSLASDLMTTTRIDEVALYAQAIEPFDSWTREVRDEVMQRLSKLVRACNPCRSASGMPDISGNAPARIVSHALRLTGSYQVIDAACASGLFALSAAVRALRFRQIDAAIVGGASYSNWLSVILFAQAQALSATGSFPFDSRADGFVSSDGYGALVVKTLPRAIADGDRIYALVSGVGTSSDGRGRSLWAPRGEGQVAALHRAYGDRIDPRGLQYIEAHGTSTQLGDATEIQSMTIALGPRLDGGAKIPVTSVKANIGHTVETAGIAGLIKTVLAIQKRVIPPAINFENPNPEIDFDKAPFFIPTRAYEWAEPDGGEPRRAGVNSFGIGGLNAHVVLEEYNPSSRTSVLVPAPPEDSAPVEQEAIAIIGMGAVFPGARTVEAFRRLLADGNSAIVPAPLERWEAQLYYSDEPRAPFKTSTRRGGFITDFTYDWRRHTIPPKQVETADPLRYMLLDATDQALADAGYQDKPFERKRTAVVVGSIIASDFFSDLSIGLRLPKLEADLRQSLEECGVHGETADEVVAEFRDIFKKRNTTVRDETGSFSSSTLASSITRTFDLMGGAFVVDSGEASSMTALDAARNLLCSGDCDVVLCAGAQRHLSMDSYEWYGMRGLLASDTAPEAGGIIPGEGAGVVMLKRLSDARRDHDHIHAILDQMELATDSAAPVPESRVASLIGNTLGASGMASLMEGVFELERKPLAKGLTVTNRSFAGLAGQVVVKSASVPEISVQEMRADQGANWRIVRLSAATLPELAARAGRARSEAVSLFETSAHSRFADADLFRLAIACDSPESLAAKCSLAAQSVLNGASRPALEDQGIYLGDCRRKPRVAVLFPGQGSQYSGMLRELVAVSPAAAARKRELDSIMEKLGHATFSQMAWDPERDIAKDVWATQVSLFLADTLAFAAVAEIGVRPDVVAGHSFGEYPALLAAGVWSLEQAIRVTHTRCELIMASVSCKGVLMATSATPETVLKLGVGVAGVVAIANHNAPDQTVLGGDEAAVNEVGRRLGREGFQTTLLPVPRPFHTPLMSPVKEPLREVLSLAELRPPTIPFLSSVTNRYVADPHDIRDNLVDQFTRPVDYVKMVRRLVDDGVNVLIEAGPRQVLSRLHRRILLPEEPVTVVSADNPKRPGLEQLTRIAAALQSAGAFPDAAQSESRPAGEAAIAHRRKIEPFIHFDATERRRNGLRSQPKASATTPAASAHSNGNGAPKDGMEAFLINFICEQTGYPSDVVQLDADLEADLGIDSLKKAQLFGELREQFDIQIQATGKLSLDDYPTLRHVLAFLQANGGEGKGGQVAVAAAGSVTELRNGSATISAHTSNGVHREAAPPSHRVTDRRPAVVPQTAPSGRIMSRFVLRMREAPLPNENAPIVWNGAALVLGENAVAEALRTRLTRSGVQVVKLPTQGTFESAIQELERLHRATPILHLFLTQACDAAASQWLAAADWQQRSDCGLMLPFLLCQRWTRLLTERGLIDRASLVSTSLLGGDFGFNNTLTAPEGGAMAGLMKSIRREFEGLTVKAIDCPPGEPAEAIATAVVSEVAARTHEVEVGYVRGRRSVVRAVPRPAVPVPGLDVESGSVWVVTGGARGVTAGVARELGRRYGLRLFLLGSTPLSAANPAWLELDAETLKERRLEIIRAEKVKGHERWTTIQRGLDVHRQLRQLAADGVEATYICCDAGDRDALARALNQARTEGGPIRGIIHGAGIELACRYENKQLANVRATIETKAGAAAALIALTKTDPIGWFITFGSVNGRFGGHGQTDYAMASDMLPKLVQALRARRPDCVAVNFDWPAWGETGMSVRPESRIALESAGYAFMPQSEGVEHLVDEIRAGAPEAEVIILDDARVIDLDRIMPNAQERGAWAGIEPLVADQPLVEGVKDLGEDRIVAEIRFDPVLDPFLSEHQYQGSGVLPSVVCLEALAEAASLLTKGRAPVLRDIQISRMFRFQSGQCQTAEAVAERSEAGVSVTLRSPLFNRAGLLVDASRTIMTGVAEEAASGRLDVPALPQPSGEWHDMAYLSREEADRSNLVVHGPRFRGLRSVVIEEREAWGLIGAPDEAEIGGARMGRWTAPCVVLDSCMVACAVHARQILGKRQLPKSFERVHCARLPGAGERCTVYVRFRESSSDATCYDFVLYSSSGDPLLKVDGHWSTILPDREV